MTKAFYEGKEDFYPSNLLFWETLQTARQYFWQS